MKLLFVLLIIFSLKTELIAGDKINDKNSVAVDKNNNVVVENIDIINKKNDEKIDSKDKEIIDGKKYIRKKVETINGIRDDINLDNILLMELKNGVVIIEMLPDVAREHVFRIKLLALEGFYNGLTFHRVIKNFIAQTGDPTATGTGGSKYGSLQAEISDLKHKRGTVSMARSDKINSANSQFFIVLSDDNVQHLDGQYTIWGKVLQGMEYIDSLKSSTSYNANGTIENGDKIIKINLGQEMNYNYSDDTEEKIEERKKNRIEILRNMKEFKKLNDESNGEKGENTPLLDKIFELNEEI